MPKFVGKFRKNGNYNDDYNYDNKRHRNEHAEIKKLIAQQELDKCEIWEDNEIQISQHEKDY